MMAEEYVRTDVFEANMKRIDQRFDSLERRMDERFDGVRTEMGQLRTEMQAGFALMNERMEKNLAEFKGEIRALDARVDALYTWQYWQIAWIGILVAGAALIPALVQYLSSKSREQYAETR